MRHKYTVTHRLYLSDKDERWKLWLSEKSKIFRLLWCKCLSLTDSGMERRTEYGDSRVSNVGQKYFRNRYKSSTGNIVRTFLEAKKHWFPMKFLCNVTDTTKHRKLSPLCSCCLVLFCRDAESRPVRPSWWAESGHARTSNCRLLLTLKKKKKNEKKHTHIHGRRCTLTSEVCKSS